MTRQVPEPGQGIIMWKSNRKEDERKNGWFYVYRNLVVTCAAAACNRACVSHKGSVQLPVCRGCCGGTAVYRIFSLGFFCVIF